jgi:hypothetical protein
MLANEFLKPMLAQVLMDLVETHTHDYRRTEDVEEVVWFLLPVESPSDSSTDAAVSDAGQEFLKREKQSVFALFSKPQVGAILAWLELARTWEDLSLRRDQVEDAVRFWKVQANCPSG